MGNADRATVIAEEQKAVDHAYECVEQRRRDAERVRNTNGSECTDAGLSYVPDVPREFGWHGDGDLGNESLVFMRVDIDDDPDGRETWRVGRRAVRDADGELAVINWTAPLAVKWMKADPVRRGEVRLRRRLRLDGRTVTDYLDDIRPPEPTSKTPVPGRKPASPQAEPSAAQADPLLLKDLDRARDGLMRDIVETIQRDQLSLVSDARPGLLVVQGGPGTGKTAVGLHRVVWLLDPENGGLAPDEVLVVGPHRDFLRYVSQVLPRLGSRNVATVEVSRLWEGEVRGEDGAAAHLVKSDERMAEVLRRKVEDRVRPEAAALHVGDEVFSAPLQGGALTIPVADVETLVAEARDSAGPYLTRRRRLIDTLVDRLLHQYAKVFPGRRTDDKLRADIERNTRVTALLNAVWPRTSAESLLRELLHDEESVHAVSVGLLTAEEQRAIVRRRAVRVAAEPWTLDDLVCLEELRHLLTGDEPTQYRHIVIDEAQDLTPMQARSLARRCPSGSMTVLGDLAQTTGVRQYDVWDRPARILSGRDGWHMAELTVGYRVPYRVMRFAVPLAEAVSSSTAVPISVRPADDPSLTIVPVGSDRLTDEAVARAFALAGTDPERGRSVALIAPDQGDLVAELSGRVTAFLEAAENDALRVTVLPAAMAKGLEFDHVVVVEPAAIAAQGAVGARSLYVAITRCTQSLTVVHSAPLPVELGGPIDPAPAPRTEERTTVKPVEQLREKAEKHDFQEFVVALEEQVCADRQCHVHELLHHRLMADLHETRLNPRRTPLIDVICKGPEGTMIYEILGEGEHTYEHMREAVLRLMEVEHVGGERAEHLFLVLPQAPEPAWAVEVLRQTFDIATIWRKGAEWEGENVATALGRPSTVEPGAG
ncbi:HelD family protein [Streptosporangium algeriense]|uniref:HelD family protein n=1 Tax=Streptosporangium algeriense TaxID=1682748 RepID=A0ABW3DH56_9ACTN